MEWLIELQDEMATEAQHQAFELWYQASRDHQRAWQHIQTVNQRMSALSSSFGTSLAQASLTDEPVSDRRYALKTLLMVLGFGLTGYGWRRGWHTDYQTRIGEIKAHTLVNDALLTLNTDSWVNVAVLPQTQDIELVRGELILQETGKQDRLLNRIRVNDSVIYPEHARLMVRQSGQQVRVSVFSGLAQLVLANGVSETLFQGDSCRFDPYTVMSKEAVIADSDRWQQGMLVARQMRLDQFVAEIARYRPGVLRCDPVIAGLKVSGTFPLQNTDLILQSVSRLLNLRVISRTPLWVQLAPA